MSYWRKFILVVLLALSLPVQSFAAVSMICAASEAGDEDATTRHLPQAELAAGHAVVADDDDHQGHHHDGSQHVHACPACASCCVGAALPAAPAVFTSAVLTQFSVPLPADAGVVSFLTAGIERPPRLILV